ncbi:MAG: hypothetical protein P8X70_01825 [Nanoarchaeota archaeon]
MIDSQLINYVRECFKRKIPIPEIKNALKSKGWKDSDINEAISIAQGKKVRKPVKKMAPISRNLKLKRPLRKFNSRNIHKPKEFKKLPSQNLEKKEKPKKGDKKNLIFIIGGIFLCGIIILIIFLILRNVSIISEEQVSQGVLIDLKENKQNKFKINDEEHTIKINSIKGNLVSLTIQSTSITMDLKVGENKKIDFEKDGYYDLYIKIENVEGEKVKVEIKKINEECHENWNCTEWGECEEGIQSRECEDLNNCYTEKNKPDEIQECEILLNCSEQKGILCKYNEVCNGNITNSSEGDCCLGECILNFTKLEMIVCEDIDCLINASKKCHPASLIDNVTLDLSILGWIQSNSHYLRINKSGNNCEYYMKLLSVNGSYTQDAINSFLAEGKNMTEIAVIEQKQNDILEKTIGVTGICVYPYDVLTQILKERKTGNFSTLSESEKEKYNCTGKLYQSSFVINETNSSY